MFVKHFKLMNTVDTGNMHAFDSQHKMKKYNSVHEILQEFYVERLKLYEKRKEWKLRCFQISLKKQAYKIKFLELVVNHSIQFRNQTKSNLVQQLAHLQFPTDIHDYLLNMPMWNMTHDKIQELKQDYGIKNEQCKKLASISPKQLWEHDLRNINSFLNTKKRSITVKNTQSNKKRRK